MIKRVFKILAGLHEESNMGCVWIPDHMDNIRSRDFITIRKGENAPLICQARIIDDNFKELYNSRKRTYKIQDISSTMIISDYYRKLLDIEKNIDVELELYKSNCFWQKIKAFLTHPNDVVKISTILAITSIIITIILGSISIIIAVIGYVK